MLSECAQSSLRLLCDRLQVSRNRHHLMGRFITEPVADIGYSGVKPVRTEPARTEPERIEPIEPVVHRGSNGVKNL